MGKKACETPLIRTKWIIGIKLGREYDKSNKLINVVTCLINVITFNNREM
ncbi:uncharacterized protein G2W53_028458 [Senna tora]|uniref:Uncharacterized protein n=1 Tax=Senna tora TaxID=362788 RepID=A0A834WET7_9FABA|nr:uncharacterized protein G2W53_028458 [Senna tora]